MIAKRGLLCAIAAFGHALVLASPVMAQTYPNRPVRIVVPYPAGGSTDFAARVIAEYLSRVFGQQFYVENKSGANGVIGIDVATRSPPDGYTILITTNSLTSNPHVYKMKSDPLKDLVPTIQLSRQPVVLAVHPSLGVASLAELIALAKQRPGLRYATGGGMDSPQHMVMQWFARLAGVSFEQVPYRGGGQAINDLIAGHVKIGLIGTTPMIPHYRAGTLRLLAQTTDLRSPALPDVPTFQEAGFQGLVLDQWVGVFVPTGTPAAIVECLNAEIGKALVDPSLRRSFLEQAQEPVGGSAEQFSRLVHKDSANYERLVKELNIKLD